MHGLSGCLPLPWPCVVKAEAEMPEWDKAPTGEDCAAEGAAAAYTQRHKTHCPPARLLPSGQPATCASWRDGVAARQAQRTEQRGGSNGHCNSPVAASGASERAQRP
jgi:hypothetical protein